MMAILVGGLDAKGYEEFRGMVGDALVNCDKSITRLRYYLSSPDSFCLYENPDYNDRKPECVAAMTERLLGSRGGVMIATSDREVFDTAFSKDRREPYRVETDSCELHVDGIFSASRKVGDAELWFAYVSALGTGTRVLFAHRSRAVVEHALGGRHGLLDEGYRLWSLPEGKYLVVDVTCGRVSMGNLNVG